QQSVSALLSKKYPMFLSVDGLSTSPVEVRNNFGPSGPRNVFRSSEPRLDELMGRANRALDPAAAAKAYQEINSYTVENAWDAPMFYIGTNWVTAKGVSYLGDGSSTLSTIRQFGVTDQ
ncbi:ABC transporter substrate-binding protein, partial [Streptomyces sp. NPDC006356]